MAVPSEYQHLQVFQGPVCLIHTEGRDKLTLNQTTLQEIVEVSEDLVIVGIAGPYRTGKSYLLNRLAGTQTGFSLGSTIEAETKGIWVWCMNHPHIQGRVLMLMDTEGLGDVTKGSLDHDVWILTLSVLLSSTLVYNILTVMNNGALQEINLVAEICKKLQNTGGNKTMSNFPLFVLTLRDFTLDLVLDGVEITPDEYFEHCLTTTDSANDLPLHKAIVEYFPKKKCFIFDRPGNKKILKNLENLPDSELDNDFVNQTKIFCEYVFSKSPTKQVTEESFVNGPRFVHMVKHYVDAISKGNVPSIHNAVEAMSMVENSRTIEEAYQLYMELMTRSIIFPTENSQQLQEVHENSVFEAMGYFENKVILDKDHSCCVQLQVKLCEELQLFEVLNRMESEKRCEDVLEELYKPIQTKLCKGEYLHCNGLSAYTIDRETMATEYQLYPDLGIQAEAVLHKFINKKQVDEGMVAMCSLQIQEQSEKIEALRAERAASEEDAEVQRRIRIDEERRFEELKQSLQDTINREEEYRREARN